MRWCSKLLSIAALKGLVTKYSQVRLTKRSGDVSLTPGICKRGVRVCVWGELRVKAC